MWLAAASRKLTARRQKDKTSLCGTTSTSCSRAQASRTNCALSSCLVEMASAMDSRHAILSVHWQPTTVNCACFAHRPKASLSTSHVSFGSESNKQVYRWNSRHHQVLCFPMFCFEMSSTIQKPPLRSSKMEPISC